jgi:hypothetical protein
MSTICSSAPEITMRHGIARRSSEMSQAMPMKARKPKALCRASSIKIFHRQGAENAEKINNND